jgi:copper resistance protein C
VSKLPSMVVADDSKYMTLDLPTLPPGTNVVHWVSVAVDGHLLEGAYKFTVK